MTIALAERPNLHYSDGTPVMFVPGDEASDGDLRRIVNEALKPYGIAVRFFKKRDEGEADFHVVDPPYAFFVERTELDDETDRLHAEKRAAQGE